VFELEASKQSASWKLVLISACMFFYVADIAMLQGHSNRQDAYQRKFERGRQFLGTADGDKFSSIFRA
jgi:hypothetical protein